MRTFREYLERAGTPPTPWIVRAALIVGGSCVLIVALGLYGYLSRGHPGHHFDEGRLGTAASVGFIAWSAILAARLWLRNTSGVGRSFWALCALGLPFIAADDLFQFHERGAVAILKLFDPSPAQLHAQLLDATIVGGYGVAALIITWPRRHELLRLPWFTLSIVAGGLNFAAMLLLDFLAIGGRAPEEAFKIMGAAFIATAFYGALFDPKAAPRPTPQPHAPPVPTRAASAPAGTPASPDPTSGAG